MEYRHRWWWQRTSSGSITFSRKAQCYIVQTVYFILRLREIFRNAWPSAKKVLVRRCRCCGTGMKWRGWMYQWGRARWFTPGQAPLLWRTACSAEPVRWAWCQTWAQCCSTCPAIPPGRKQREDTEVTRTALFTRLHMKDAEAEAGGFPWTLRNRQNLNSVIKSWQGKRRNVKKTSNVLLKSPYTVMRRYFRRLDIKIYPKGTIETPVNGNTNKTLCQNFRNFRNMALIFRLLNPATDRLEGFWRRDFKDLIGALHVKFFFWMLCRLKLSAVDQECIPTGGIAARCNKKWQECQQQFCDALRNMRSKTPRPATPTSRPVNKTVYFLVTKLLNNWTEWVCDKMKNS